MKPFFAACFVALSLAGCDSRPVERTEWLQMGTTAAVQTRGPVSDVRIREVRGIFTALEGSLNAHDAGSELSRLAEATDAEILARCGASVKPCYEAAFALSRMTDGAFNPRWRGERTFDLGAIAKGFALDEASRKVVFSDPTLLDIGGNLKSCRGNWRVGVKGGGSFVLREGEACATSARYYRGDHIRDGRDGTVVTGDVYSVTVVHPTSAMLADGLSTVLFILGREEGDEFLRRNYPEAKSVWVLGERRE